MVSYIQVLILQTHWRRWLAQKFVSALRAEKQKRLEWEKQVLLLLVSVLEYHSNVTLHLLVQFYGIDNCI